MKCSVCGQPIEDRGYKHAQCRFCGQVSNLCCDPEMECVRVDAVEDRQNLPPMPAGPLPFQAILFDLDNTLYDREAAFGRWADAYLRDTLRLTDPEEAACIRALIFAMDADGYGSKAAIFERLHALYPALPGVPARSVDVFFDEFLAHITPEAETESLLDALADARLPFGVITNGSARQWRKIEGLGLARRTDCLFVSETFGGKKPDPAIFHAAAAHLGVPPAEILFIGDNPAVDVRGAQAAGMKAAWLHGGHPWPEGLAGEPDFVIGSLGELAGILGLP
jgi:putative hydrolase of the HAD superfamily